MPILSARMKPKDAWTFFILPIVTALLIASVCSVTDQQDVDVLQNLYRSLNSPAQLTGWSAQGSSSDPCTQAWKGVTCVGTSVTELNLANLGLSGGLGYMLQQLTSVHVFDVSGNSFSGSVPYQLPPNLATLNMERNSFSGNLPFSITNMVNLTTLKFAHNQLSGELADVFSSLGSLNFLDLSFNQLTGDLPSSFVHLQSLATLYLQSNQFTGTLNVLDSVQSLTDVNVENNKFTGWVPAVFQNNGNFQYSGNNFNSSPAPPPPPYTPPPARSSPPSTRGSGTNSSPNSSSNNNGNNENKSSGLSGGAVAGIVIVILLAVLAGSIALFCLFKKKKRKNVSDEEARIHTGAAMGSTFQPSTQVVEEKPKPKLVESSTALKPPPMEWFKGEKESGKKSAKKKSADIAATAFSVAELQVATNSFSQDNLVGEGALGRVYRADIPSGKVLAVKKIDALSSDTLQNDEDFMEIVSNISRLRHSNIAELVGYCTEHRQRLLMYDYYSKGTLHDILHSADDNLKRELVWNIRVKIALGAARALEYLHEVCLPAVVHKNFKSGNILLDEELNPHLADCGIAVFSPSLDPQASNLGYSAPEHAMSGIYTAKSDVYSFGVVMLELLTGRKPLDSSRPRSEQSLVRWATPQLHDIDALDKMVDPVLNGMYPAKSLSRFADVIALCVQPEPEFRPPISEVVQSLVRLMQRASSSTMNKRRAGGEEQNNNDSYDAIV